MAIQLGSAYGKISLDSSGFVAGIKKSKESLSTLSNSAAQFGAAMKDIGQKLTLGLTLPIAGLGAASIKMASDMVETKSKVQVVFGEMSDAVTEWSVNSSNSMQLSRQEALEAASTFGNLFVAMKVGQKDAAEMSMSLVQLAGDLGSINNIDPSLVLIKLKSGIVGETEAVRDLGIDLRATTVEAKAMEMGFQKVNDQFAQGDLIAARYALILEQTKVAQGDIARTGGELSGQLRTLHANWKDVLAVLGQSLLPIAKKVVTVLNEWLEKFKNLSPAQQKLIIYVGLFLAVLGPLMIALGTVIPLLKLTHQHTFSLGGAILSVIFGFAKLVAAAAIVVSVLEYFGVATGAVGAGVVALNTAIVGVGATIGSIVLPVLAVIAVIALLYIAWKKNLFGIQDLVAKSAAGYRQAWARFTEWWKTNSASTADEVRMAFAQLPASIQASFRNIGSSVSGAWSNFMNWIRNALSQIRGYMANAFTNVNWSVIGKNILLGIANGMLLGLPNLLTIVVKVAQSVLTQIKKSLGIKSPSSEAMKLGAYTAQGFALGLQSMSPEAISRSLIKPITNPASTNQQNITMQFASGVTISQVRGMIAESHAEIVNTMIGALNG